MLTPTRDAMTAFSWRHGVLICGLCSEDGPSAFHHTLTDGSFIEEGWRHDNVLA